MASLAQLIKSSKQRPVLRLYIKRRLVDGTYESDWTRIDWYKNRQRVLSYGSVEIGAELSPEIGSVSISDITIELDNTTGFFNVETDVQSIFYPDSTYLNRKFTRIKIEAGYLDSDDSEVGVESCFEGLVDSVTLSQSQVATVTALSYASILTRFPISDLAMTGSKTVSQIITLIMNQSKITEYIPYVAPSPGENVTIQDTSTLDGSYWDIIQKLAIESSSVPILIGTEWAFKPYTPSIGTVWDFYGAGSSIPNILDVVRYDDEGAGRVRLYWKAQNSSLYSISSNTTLVRKYFSDPKSIDLDDYSDLDKQIILDALLELWESPKPIIELNVPFLVNEVSPLDRVTIENIGPIYPLDFIRWDAGGKWDDGSVWGEFRGSVNILSGTEWMVTKIAKDFDNWRCNIVCEKIV